MCSGRFVIWFFVLLLTLFAPARAADVVLVLSDNSGVYAEFGELLKRNLEGSAWRVSNVVTAEALESDKAPRGGDAWVTVGSEATRAALARSSAPVLATLVPRQSFERLVSEAGGGKGRGASAVVLDQPAGRQLLLVQQVLGKKKLGLLASPEQRQMATRLQQAAQAQGLSLEIEEVGDDASVIPAVNRLLPRVDALLAVPDSIVYSRNNIRPILLASYRYQRPVIGYSAAFVNAGALAGIYSSPAQVARQVAELLISGKRLTGIVAPEKFSLSYNRQVANSLGIELPDEASVLRALEGRRFDP